MPWHPWSLPLSLLLLGPAKPRTAHATVARAVNAIRVRMVFSMSFTPGLEETDVQYIMRAFDGSSPISIG